MRFPLISGAAPALRAGSLALILFSTIGCSAVQQVRPAEFIPRHSPDLVWVTTKDSVFPVARPHIDGDTLRGSDLQGAVAIPLENIQRVRAKAPAPDRTTLFVAAMVAVGLYWTKLGSFPSGHYVYVPDGDCHCVSNVDAWRQ